MNPIYPRAPAQLHGQELLHWITQQGSRLPAPPGSAFSPPLRPGPVSQHLFNPFARLTTAQITDLRHSHAFREWMRERAIPPIDRMAYNAASGQYWANILLHQNPRVPLPPLGVPTSDAWNRQNNPVGFPQYPRYPY